MKSSFLADALDEVLNNPVDDSLDDWPSEDEVLEALMKMKCGKTGGKNGVLPELLKCCSGSLPDQVGGGAIPDGVERRKCSSGVERFTGSTHSEER